MDELEVRVYEGEIVETGWYEQALSAYIQADEKVTEGQWQRAQVAHYLVGRAYQVGDKGLIKQFAGDVRRSAKHLYREAEAYNLKVQLEESGWPEPSSLGPSFYEEAARIDKRAIEAGDKRVVKAVGRLLEKAEDEHWTKATLRKEVDKKRERKEEPPGYDEIPEDADTMALCPACEGMGYVKARKAKKISRALFRGK